MLFSTYQMANLLIIRRQTLSFPCKLCHLRQTWRSNLSPTDKSVFNFSPHEPIDEMYEKFMLINKKIN